MSAFVIFCIKLTNFTGSFPFSSLLEPFLARPFSELPRDLHENDGQDVVFNSPLLTFLSSSSVEVAVQKNLYSIFFHTVFDGVIKAYCYPQRETHRLHQQLVDQMRAETPRSWCVVAIIEVL